MAGERSEVIPTPISFSRRRLLFGATQALALSLLAACSSTRPANPNSPRKGPSSAPITEVHIPFKYTLADGSTPKSHEMTVEIRPKELDSLRKFAITLEIGEPATGVAWRINLMTENNAHTFGFSLRPFNQPVDSDWWEKRFASIDTAKPNELKMAWLGSQFIPGSLKWNGSLFVPDSTKQTTPQKPSLV